MILSKSRIYEVRIINSEIMDKEIQECCCNKLRSSHYGVIMAAEKGYEKLMYFFASACKRPPWNLGLFWANDEHYLNFMQFFIAMGADDWFTGTMYAIDKKLDKYIWKKFYE